MGRVEKAKEEKDKKQNSQNRITYIDIARGIAIILMVMGHVYPVGTFVSKKIIYSFHMPLFIIVSGMFFKENIKIKDMVVNIWKKLLFPYIITIFSTGLILGIIGEAKFGFESIVDIIKQILLGHSNLRTFCKEIQITGALWFIPFLAATRIMFYIISKIFKSDIAKGIVSCLVTIIGVCLAKYNIFLPWSFDIVLATMIFYYSGYILKKYNYVEKITGNPIMLFILFNIWYIGLLFKNLDLALRIYSIIGYIVALSGAIVVLWISKLIEYYSKFISKILKWYGINSLYILCFHYCDETIMKYEQFGITNIIGKFIIKIILVSILSYITIKVIHIIKNIKLRKEEEGTNE